MTGSISEVAMKRAFLLLVLFLLVFPASVHARTWHVRQDGSGDCTTIQACIDSAGNGDTVLVGPGVYCEAVSIANKSNLVLKSQEGPAQTKITNYFGITFRPCIMCGDLLGENVIEGFTFAQCAGFFVGAAIYAGQSALTIRDNVFFDCGAGGIDTPGLGGAVFFDGSSGRIVQNTFHYCNSGLGGAIALQSSSVVIDRNVITGCFGGGIWANVMPIITCNDVWGNSPSNYLGAITDQTGMNGNISVDPMFCGRTGPYAGNFFLNSSSPCLNAPGCGMLGALPMGCGATAVEETTWGKIKVLFR